jgi:DNA invertase Pin-like site-specific DNA recombinase
MAKVGYMVASVEQPGADSKLEALRLLTDRIFEDKVIGKEASRPEFWKMMGQLKPGDVLIIESISSLAKTTRDLLQIIDELILRGVGLVSLKEGIDTVGPQGGVMLKVFAALSELDKGAIVEWQKDRITAAKKKNKYPARPR